jgi:DNA-binding CsgD family transcriptional regulator
MMPATHGLSAPDGFRLTEFGMIGAIANWCECIHGKRQLLTSLQMIANGLDAEAVAIVRYARGGIGDSRPIAWDRAARDVRGGRLERGFARSLLGGYFDAARPGSLWFRSMQDDAAPDLAEFHTLRVLRELVVIPLDVDDRHVDAIEFHFSEKLRSYQQLLLNSLAPVLSETWRNRAQGLFTENLLHRAEVQRAPQGGKAILSTDNPARLSRAEYRVGLMLSRGLSTDEVMSALNIRESTLRTHLGNLYAKTHAQSLSELVYLLVSASPVGRRAGAGTARLA